MSVEPLHAESAPCPEHPEQESLGAAVFGVCLAAFATVLLEVTWLGLRASAARSAA